ncbi:unnamed protein product [Cuscuta europaea]|uniref:Uncharacterized protein n=1 Tax=Cuscuta europaea TaxID=41803 RepID=A0A9P0YW52_CUSEU|nr:unnamed protein product [Cuscuta europaea]
MHHKSENDKMWEIISKSGMVVSIIENIAKLAGLAVSVHSYGSLMTFNKLLSKFLLKPEKALKLQASKVTLEQKSNHLPSSLKDLHDNVRKIAGLNAQKTPNGGKSGGG